MKKDPALYQLIHSLTGSEKRHLTIFLKSGKEDSVTLQLFNALASQKVYNDEKIIEKFKGQAWTRQYHVACNYLFKQILKSLRNYHSSVSVDQELKDMLRDVEILHQKAMYSICEKHLKKARQLAEKFEKQLALLEIIEWERKVRQRLENMVLLKEQLLPAHEEELTILKRYENRAIHRVKAYEVFLLSRKNATIRNDAQRAEFGKVMEDPEYINLEAQTFQAKFDMINTRAIWYRAIEAREKFYKERKKLVELNEKNLHLAMENPGGYLATINNMIIACMYVNKMDEALKYINKMKAFPTRAEDLKLKIFTTANNLQLSYYQKVADFSSGLKLIDEIEKGMEIYGSKMNAHQRKAFYYNMAYICFCAGKFKKALKFTNQILDEKESELRVDIHSFSRILSILIHYELDNREQLEYFIRSASRFLDKRDRSYRFESLILTKLRMLTDIKVKTNPRSFFKDFLKEIEEITQDQYEKRLLENFDFISWLKSKISGRTFEQEIKAGLNN